MARQRRSIARSRLAATSGGTSARSAWSITAFPRRRVGRSARSAPFA